METNEVQKTSDAALLVKIAEKLLEVQREIDELVLQFALGKAEARDKFEETKNELRSRVSEFRSSPGGQKAEGASSRLKGLLEELELQLNLGKAESKDNFKEQKKKIEVVIDKVRSEVQKIKDAVFDREHIVHELEKFKLKLEVLRLRFELKKFEVRDSFKEGMHQARKRIEQTTSKLKDKLNPEKSVFDQFKKESQDIYKHLREVIDSISK